MLTFFFELYFLLLPYFNLFFQLVGGSVFFIFILPTYLSTILPEPQNYVFLEAIQWLYYALMASSAIVFMIYCTRRLPEVISSARSSYTILSKRMWLAVWCIVFLFLFPALLTISQNTYLFQGEGGIGFAILMTIFFFVFAGHAALLVFIVFAVKAGILYLAKRSKALAQFVRILPTPVTKGIHVLLLLYPLVVGIATSGAILTDDLNNPQASRFFVINAAIKNTCFIDPNRTNCPKSAEEIGYIEPTEYQMMKKCCQIRYQYNPDNNQYSLVVRYNPTKAVLFDWRLVSQDYQMDFKEYDVAIIGKDHLVNPPPWDGPWEFEDWQYL